jgi:anti-sigma B factor antagonist
VTPELSIIVRMADDECVVVVTGEVDMASAPQLRNSLAAVTGVVVIDLAGVTYLDSSGISVLVHVRNRVRTHGGDLKIRDPHDNVRAVLRVVGLTDWIE